MTIQRTNILALLAAGLLALGATTAQAQPGTEDFYVTKGALVEGAHDTVIVSTLIGARTETCFYSGGSFTIAGEWNAVAIDNPSNNPVGVEKQPVNIHHLFSESFDVGSGTRITNLQFLGTCEVDGVTYDGWRGTPQQPQNGDVALVVTPSDSLTADHEAVVGGGTDELGIADAVCLNKGEQPFHSEMLSNVDLLPGDRLTEFVEVDYDPETGETTYACWLEY